MRIQNVNSGHILGKAANDRGLDRGRRLRRASRSVIENLEQRQMLSAYPVTNTNYSGTGSLTAAINAALIAHDTAAMITFSGVPSNSTIQLDSSTVNPAAAQYGPTAYFIGQNFAQNPAGVHGVQPSGANITIDGLGAPGLTIDGGSAVRLFAVQSGFSLTLDNLTLKDGSAQGGTGGADGGGGGAGLGGAVFDDGGNFTAQGCTFANNAAAGGTGGSSNPAFVSGGGGSGGGGGGLGGNGAGGGGFTGGMGGGVFGGGGGNNSSSAGGPGGFGGGGGGGGGSGHGGGHGGFGGGGGGGASGTDSGGAGGAGGFGGGGGGGGSAGFNGESGSGGSGGQGGFGGGAGGRGANTDAGAGGGAGGGGAGLGGGIFGNAGAITLNNDTFNGNSATGGNPGSGQVFMTSASANASATHSAQTDDGAGLGLGGAVFTHNGTLTVLNSTISGNTADDGGRGIYVLGDGTGIDTIPNSNGPDALFGPQLQSSVHHSAADAGAFASINNTIIGQSDTDVSDFVASNFNGGFTNTTGVGNLIRSATGFNGTIVSSADPQLSALASNGGPTQTMALGATSPAIDAGNDSAAASLVYDQRGPGFPRFKGSHVDIGAFESTPVVANVITATPVNGSVLEGRSVGLVATFTDSNTSLGVANFATNIVWGDGATTGGTVVMTSAGHFQVFGSHAYPEETTKPYTVTVTITPINTPPTGRFVQVVDKVTVAPAPLDTPGGLTLTIPVGKPATNLVVGSFRDQDSLETDPKNYLAQINWGDSRTVVTTPGTAALTAAVFNDGTYWNVMGTHNYAQKGTYTVTITVTEADAPSEKVVITSIIHVV